MDLEEFDRSAGAAIAAIPSNMRPSVLGILTLPYEERASAIEVIYREGLVPNLAELLMELEEEPRLRRWIVEELRRLLR